MGIKFCRICGSSMWDATDTPENVRLRICNWCAEKHPEKKEQLKEEAKERRKERKRLREEGLL